MSDVSQIDQAINDLEDTITKAKAETEIIQRFTSKLNEKLTCYEISLRLDQVLILLNDTHSRVRSFDTEVIGKGE